MLEQGSPAFVLLRHLEVILLVIVLQHNPNEIYHDLAFVCYLAIKNKWLSGHHFMTLIKVCLIHNLIFRHFPPEVSST